MVQRIAGSREWDLRELHYPEPGRQIREGVMDTANLLDPTDTTWEPQALGRVPYSGCLSIGIVGHLIACAMPRFIELDEIARPLSTVSIVGFDWAAAR